MLTGWYWNQLAMYSSSTRRRVWISRRLSLKRLQFAARYQKDTGIGTVIALMLPYALILAVAWTAFFMLWYLVGIPLGPGWPV